MLMGYVSTTDRYRARTAASAPVAVVLRRQKCTCGKESTAKQLRQYGLCIICARKAAADKAVTP